MVPEQMLFGIKPVENQIAGAYPYVQYSGSQRILSGPECREIIAVMGKKTLHPGKIGTTPESARLDQDYRSVFTNSLPVTGLEWLYERLLQRVKWVNDDKYHFDISGMAEPIQFLEYRQAKKKSEKSGRYNWHTDMGPGIASIRKLSVVIQLSQPSEYEGCRLNLFDCKTPILELPEIGQGDMVVFPSFMPHMVSPLIKGTRRSLALWVSGPPYK